MVPFAVALRLISRGPIYWRLISFVLLLPLLSFMPFLGFVAPSPSYRPGVDENTHCLEIAARWLALVFWFVSWGGFCVLALTHMWAMAF